MPLSLRMKPVSESGPGANPRPASFQLGVSMRETHEAAAVAISSEDIYLNPNGDSWRLIRDTESKRVIVRREASLSLGGRVPDMDLNWFLDRGASGPEYAALSRLLGRATHSG